MAVIDTQNAKQIRDPMIISCGMAAESRVTITCSDFSGFFLQDTNPNASLKSDEWPLRRITDLQGDGFPLDGSCEFYEAGAGSADGKIGVKTHIGGTGSFTVSASSEIPALTIYTEGDGTITADSAEYELRGVNVVPVNATSITLTFESSDEYRRVEVISVVPGVNLSWNNDTLVSVQLNLRSDLAIENNQWMVSEIEIRAYYPDDISEAVSGISDDVPIWYTAGYAGNMSTERRFYLSEPVTMDRNIITIKGRDASHKLVAHGNAAHILNTTTGSGRRDLYAKMAYFIEDAGIKLRAREAAPAPTSGTTQRTLIFKSNTYDSIVANIMNLSHTGTYWPTFVDAGIPRIYHTKPTKKWDINEEDCGNVTRTADRNVSKIRSDDDYGLHSKVVRSNELQEIVRRHVTAGARYTQNAGGYFWALNVSNAVSVFRTAESVRWTADQTTREYKTTGYGINEKGEIVPTVVVQYINECIVKGKAADIEVDAETVTATPARAGVTMEASPIAYGQVYGEPASGQTAVFIYPNYRNLFHRSNITGSFLWKGDPRMQPRDVFSFHRLDGTEELCTIESITLKHEGGGTTAEIAYRLGVC